jgi:hypothetical protein
VKTELDGTAALAVERQTTITNRITILVKVLTTKTVSAASFSPQRKAVQKVMSWQNGLVHYFGRDGSLRAMVENWETRMAAWRELH